MLIDATENAFTVESGRIIIIPYPYKLIEQQMQKSIAINGSN